MISFDDLVGPVLAETPGRVDELVRGARDGLVGQDREPGERLREEGGVGLGERDDDLPLISLRRSRDVVAHGRAEVAPERARR